MRSWALYAFVFILSAGMVVSCSTPSETIEFSEHPAGWTSENSDNFHGFFVLESVGKTDNCTSCHGVDLEGDPAKAETSCFKCHAAYPHPEGFANSASDDFHTVTIAQTYWDIAACQSCHGVDYAGENFPAKNCLTCHTDDNGPEACNTCHGDPDHSKSFAPPEDLSGSDDTSSPGVGAHQFHLVASAITDALTPACSHCHMEPSSFSADGHLDDGPAMAELLFSDLATNDGALAATYDPASRTCSNVYCHGGFEFLKSESSNPFIYTDDAITGNSLPIGWTDVGSGAAVCGTCHGLPPTGHSPISACQNCHGSVVDANKNIIDPSKHINGEIDVF